jgi:hypothetical protein
LRAVKCATEDCSTLSETFIAHNSCIPVKPVTVHRTPRLPDSHVFPNRAVTATWYIGKNPVEKKRLRSRRQALHLHFLGFRGRRILGDTQGQRWIVRCVHVRDEHGRTGDTGRLMDEEVRALVVAVVRDEKASGN